MPCDVLRILLHVNNTLIISLQLNPTCKTALCSITRDYPGHIGIDRAIRKIDGFCIAY